MKKNLLLITLALGGVSAFGQKTPVLTPAASTNLKIKSERALDNTLEKTLLCVDTIRYPQAKEQILGTNNFATFGLWTVDVESMSQKFLNTGNISISGIEFFGANDPTNGTANVTVNAGIYNVNASNNPTTLIASGTVTFSSATAGYHYVSFAPVTVSGNYAIVIRPTSANGVLDLFVNDPLTGQTYDEDFARVKSNYYASSGGLYIPITSFTEIGPPAKNFEPIVAPIISYTINTSFTATPNPVCLGTPVTFTGTNTPAYVFTNRMLDYQKFRQFFGTAATDSTFVYDMANGTAVWSTSTSYAHPAAGTFNVDYVTLGGFWNSCTDFATIPLVVNPLPVAPTVTAGGPLTFCAGGSVVLTSSAATGNLWSTGETTAAITVSTAGSITVTQTALGCTSPNSIAQVTVVTALDNATYAYSSNTLCTGGANETPTFPVAGTFTSTPLGLSLNGTTGQINMATSANGTYNVVHQTAGACPNSTSQSITITAAPVASFTYASATYCSVDADPSPVFGVGASGGTFTAPSANLVINASTGAIDLSASVPGTYLVTNTIAAAGVCPMVQATYSVTVNATPAAFVTGGGTVCGTGSMPITIALTGTAPWNFSYSDGTTTTPVVGQMTSPYVFNATTSGSYTVTTVSSTGCSAAGLGTAVVVFNANPVVTFGALTAVCENASDVALTGSPAGGTYTGSSITAASFDPSVGAGTYPMSYAYTDGNGCTGSANSSIVVNASPTAALTTFSQMCVYNPAIVLTGGTPAGGVYSGPGVSGGSFDPATAGNGTHVITYTVTLGSCSTAVIENLTVDACLGLVVLQAENLSIVPNPATDALTIAYTGVNKSAIDLSLVTADGKIVAHKIITNADGFSEVINVSAFAKGIYIVKLKMNNETITKKVVIQ